ncbi:MAG: lycopene cyclase domain-containing protein [Candidatus Saccharibacteria bacterium]
MFSYLLISSSLIILSIIVLFLFINKISIKATLLCFLVIFITMILFDNYLTTIPIVMYNSNHILGVKLGSIPIEDFSYLIAAVIIVPVVYELMSDE